MEVGIVHYTGGEIGGVETVIRYHAKILGREGHTTHLIYGTGGKLHYSNVHEHEIPLLSPRNPEIERIQDELLCEGSSERFESAKDEIKQDLLKAIEGVRVCMVHNIPSMPYNFAATAAINDIADESGIEMIFWVHDSVIIRPEWEYMGVVVDRVDHLGDFPFTLLHHKGPHVKYVTPTRVRARELDNSPEPYRVPASMTTVIPNGIDIREYLKIDSVTKRLMSRLGLSFEDHIMVTPVRVTPRKNIELALSVAERLKRFTDPSHRIRLIITGPPDHQAVKMGVKYLDYLRDLIKKLGLQENVIFCHNMVARKRVYRRGTVVKWSVADVYNIADIIFVPSKEEGFGLPVIEAGAARKPIFCSRISPFRELIRDDIEGYMFSLDDDPEDIALRIYRYIMESKVERNFDNVIKNFGWDSIVRKQVIPLLRRVARRAHR